MSKKVENVEVEVTDVPVKKTEDPKVTIKKLVDTNSLLNKECEDLRRVLKTVLGYLEPRL